MPTLQLDLKGRKDPVYVHDMERYEDKDGWLIIYKKGDEVMGRYNLADLAGYHVLQPRDMSF